MKRADASTSTMPRMPFVGRLPETLYSERLLIRVARPGDGAMLAEAIAESHTDLAPWLDRGYAIVR